jgi:Cu-Zn family superoxide dismutase
MTHYAKPVLLALALAGCQTTTGQTSRIATATLANAAGQDVGTATLLREGGATRIDLTVKGNPGAVHGLHLHMVGRCEAPFTSAGPHLNPGGHQHGRDNPMGTHLGDLPNVTIGQSGSGTASANLGNDPAALDAALFDADGTAIVLHAAADDYRTDPSGNSGARIACGVLTRS